MAVEDSTQFGIDDDEGMVSQESVKTKEEIEIVENEEVRSEDAQYWLRTCKRRIRDTKRWGWAQRSKVSIPTHTLNMAYDTKQEVQQGDKANKIKLADVERFYGLKFDSVEKKINELGARFNMNRYKAMALKCLISANGKELCDRSLTDSTI